MAIRGGVIEIFKMSSTTRSLKFTCLLHPAKFHANVFKGVSTDKDVQVCIHLSKCESRKPFTMQLIDSNFRLFLVTGVPFQKILVS